MKDPDDALWKLDVLRNALKRKSVSTDNQLQWLGMVELLHDCIHKLHGDCGTPHCDGADQEVLTRFIDHCT
jgi:hypothetical protein